MYRLLRVYNDGTIIIGEVLYHEYHLNELISLISSIHQPETFELCIGLEIEL